MDRLVDGFRDLLPRSSIRTHSNEVLDGLRGLVTDLALNVRDQSKILRSITRS